MPPGWIQEKGLGEDFAPGSTWFGSGTWAADRHGPPSPFVQSLGYGNSLTGQGFLLEAGTKGEAWDLAGQLLLYRDADGASRASVQQAHAWYRSQGGWVSGFEKEPLVWGYGLNGGYLLGEAARPVGKLRVQTPRKALSLFSVPLGRWSAQMFLGKLEARRDVGETYQSPAWYKRETSVRGEPQGPMLSGFRVDSAFGDSTEFYLNWMVEFGGSVNGVSMTRGYGISDYLTAFTGTKDFWAESGKDIGDFSQSDLQVPYVNKARSSTNLDAGARVRIPPLERLFEASDVRFYVSRGTKGASFSYKLAMRRPFYYFGKDISSSWPPSRAWNQNYHYYSPTPLVPNDCVGLTVRWQHFRLGLEYIDAVNRNDGEATGTLYGYRPFYNSVYKSGFYYYGDPLGSGLGGEARYGTIRAEWDLNERLSLQTWIHCGNRPYRDETAEWSLEHSGQTPAKTRFTGLQQKVHWKANRALSVDAGCSWQHQTHADHVLGETRNGFRWFSSLTWRWLK